MIPSSYIRSEKGERTENEDAGLVCRRKDGVFLYIVADGLGGHGRGAEASYFVTEYIKNEFLKQKQIDSAFLKEVFFKAQTALLKKKEDERKKDPEIQNKAAMLTTAAALIADENHFQFANTGDSRVYVFKDSKAVMRSRDHSIPQILYEQGKIKESEIRHHPDRNKIICAFGIPGNDFRCEVSPVYRYAKNYDFMLCTDGLWENVTEMEAETALSRSKTPASWADRCCLLVEKSKNPGRLDNYTIITVKADGQKK